MTFYEFAGAHPVLTFLLAYIAGMTLINVVKSFRGRK